jgi:hypothetical protein
VAGIVLLVDRASLVRDIRAIGAGDAERTSVGLHG